LPDLAAPTAREGAALQAELRLPASAADCLQPCQRRRAIQIDCDLQDPPELLRGSWRCGKTGTMSSSGFAAAARKAGC